MVRQAWQPLCLVNRTFNKVFSKHLYRMVYITEHLGHIADSRRIVRQLAESRNLATATGLNIEFIKPDALDEYTREGDLPDHEEDKAYHEREELSTALNYKQTLRGAKRDLRRRVREFRALSP